MHRTPRLPLVVLAACWLMAGPGGVTLQAIACPHDAVSQGTHGTHGHHAPLPAGAPCFCGEMTGGAGLALTAPALPAPRVIGTLIAAAVMEVAVPRLPTPVSSFSPPPVPPPPELRA